MSCCGRRRTRAPSALSGELLGPLALAISGHVQSVPAGAGVAVALGTVAGEIEEYGLTARRDADPQPVDLVGGDHLGQGHSAIDRQVLGQAGIGGEVVHVPAVVVVVGQAWPYPRMSDELV